MPDLKITEFTELEDTQTGDGVDDSDFIAIVDQSEADINLKNKKIRVRTLHEFLAPLDSALLTGEPRSTTPPINNNSTRIATTEWVQNELGTISLNTLSDVTIGTTPQANQILVYNDLTGTFQAQSPTTVARKLLTGTETLTSASAQYQFLNPNGSSRDVILPLGTAGLRFVIKTLDTNFNLNIKETVAGPVEATVNISSEVAECVYDGVEWHIILY